MPEEEYQNAEYVDATVLSTNEENDCASTPKAAVIGGGVAGLCILVAGAKVIYDKFVANNSETKTKNLNLFDKWATKRSAKAAAKNSEEFDELFSSTANKLCAKAEKSEKVETE